MLPSSPTYFQWLILVIILFSNPSSLLFAQQDSLLPAQNHLYTELSGGASNSGQTPFWVRSNQYGTIPNTNTFGLIKVGGQLQLGKPTSHWRIQTEGIMTISPTPKLILPVGNVTYQFKKIELYVGRRKEIFGLCDTLSGSGSYIWSGNALPMPKVHIGTLGYVPLKFTRYFVSINGTIAHGWFGKGQFAQDYFLHQKSLFIRLGKPFHSVKFYAGIVHFAQWGGKAPLLIGLNRTGPNGEFLNSLRDFWSVVIVQSSSYTPNTSPYDLGHRIGNHVGSINLCTSFRRPKSDWLFFYQRPIETEAFISRNFPDGQYGISWKNGTRKEKHRLSMRHITIEYLTTLKQNLRYDTQWGYMADGYFNNSQYMDGWAYKKNIIGTPLFTLRTDTQPQWFDVAGSYKDKIYYQINGNSLRGLTLDTQFSLGVSGCLRLKFVPSLYHIYYNNDGSYNQILHQFSSYFEYSQTLSTHPRFSILLAIASDKGEWLPNSTAMFASLRYNIIQKESR